MDEHMESQQNKSDDHSVRIGCAQAFERIRGEIKRLQNGHSTQAAALNKLTDAVEASTIATRADHDETMRMIQGYQNNIVGLIAAQSERAALLDASTSALHSRVDVLDAKVQKDHDSMTGLLVKVSAITAGLVFVLTVAVNYIMQ